VQHEPLLYRSIEWSLIFFTSVSFMILHEIWVLARQRRCYATRSDCGSRRLILGANLVAAATTLSVPWMTKCGTVSAAPTFLFFAAISLMLLGLFVRFWAVLTLGRFFHSWVYVDEDHRLVMTGPYRYLRNPSYTGWIVAMFGVGLAQGNVISMVIGLIIPLIAYVWRIHVEECSLRTRFGHAYDEYASRSWTIIPLIW
jgi:protein-S-isoprenylcysteine O-methyltransferase